MIQIVWRYEVKAEERGSFELAYGPGGAWAKLFSASPGYRGTVLLRDTTYPRRYLTIDTWDSQELRDAFLARHRDEYATLDATFAPWTEAEEELGVFRLLAEATVRPAAGRARRRPDGRPRGRG